MTLIPKTVVRTEAGERSGASPSPGGGILLISYHFPPSAAVGGRRMAHFAVGLRRLGWDAHVLTIPEHHVEELDRGRLKDVEGVPVHTATAWPTFVGAITALTKIRKKGGAAGSAVLSVPPDLPGAPPAESLLKRIRRYVMSFALLPDGYKGWCVPAMFAASSLIRRHRLDWFMTSCPPYSVHLVGLGVRLLTGAHWVADFRDPWMTTGWKRLYPTCVASIRIESWLERLVVERADLVVFNVDRLRGAYRDRYSHVRADKFVYIPNGLASTVVPPPIQKLDRFTITYTGSLYVGRSPEPVFRALAQLIREGAIASESVNVKLVGHCRYIDTAPTTDVIRRYGLESVVEVQDPVPYAEAVDLVRRSHLALLLAPNLPYQIPAKVYDYLSTGTRILGIAEDGGTADVLKETGAGVAFADQDVAGIAGFIRAELASREQPPAPLSLARFDVQNLTEELIGHLDRVEARRSAEKYA